jgi:hypothetical protein
LVARWAENWGSILAVGWADSWAGVKAEQSAHLQER